MVPSLEQDFPADIVQKRPFRSSTLPTTAFHQDAVRTSPGVTLPIELQAAMVMPYPAARETQEITAKREYVTGFMVIGVMVTIKF